jgi:hypothetical protein
VKPSSVAAGAGRQCAPAALIGRFWAAHQLHRYAASSRGFGRVVSFDPVAGLCDDEPCTFGFSATSRISRP